MTAIIPEPNYWLRTVVIITERTDASRTEQEQLALCRCEPEPAGSQHT
jgi:hypothetical protein